MNIERLNVNVNGAPAPSFIGDKLIFDELAKRMGAPLPDDYIDFIMMADGGCPEIGSFFPLGESSENLFDIAWFYTFSNPAIEDINNVLDGWGKVLGGYMLPIACDGGGNQIYLNLKESVPSVWIYLHDEDGARVKLANSFEEFISGLRDNPDLI